MADQIKLKRYSTLEDAVKADEFYLVNYSNNTAPGEEKRRLGVLLMSYRTAQNEPRNIYIPPTWVPIDLKNYADTEDLAKMGLLRDYVRRGIVVLLDKASYEAVCANPKYEEEFNKYADKLGVFSNHSGSATTDFSLNLTGAGSAIADIAPVETPIARQIIETEGDDEAMIAAYDGALGGLSIGEISYLVAHAKPTSLMKQIADELNTRLKNGKPLPTKSVRETEAYQDYLKTNMNSPTFSFV